MPLYYSTKLISQKCFINEGILNVGSLVYHIKMKSFADNRRARFDYDIKGTFDAGLVLSGAEVKSVKGGNVSLEGAYVSVSAGGVSLVNCHIGPYKYAANEKYSPTQTRSLLLNKAE